MLILPEVLSSMLVRMAVCMNVYVLTQMNICNIPQTEQHNPKGSLKLANVALHSYLSGEKPQGCCKIMISMWSWPISKFAPSCTRTLSVYCLHQVVLISLAWSSRISLVNAGICLSHSAMLEMVATVVILVDAKRDLLCLHYWLNWTK